ncbi:matrixin family metalloprotease [Candidatus Kaiserbacteria bacterium]|nr:matrixin family metalloprotease [Candidatus Kaiserbacteria bacterium]
MRRVLPVLILILTVAGAAYHFRSTLTVVARQVYGRALPCSQPVTYSLGAIDPKFGISQKDVLSALDSAGRVWDTAAGKSLFSYVPEGGVVTVNLVYDDRQTTTMKLKSLGITISNDKNSYDTVNAEYKKLYAAYISEKSDFDAKNAQLTRDAEAYQAEVERVNARGGATPAEYARLRSEHDAILARQESLKALQDKVNKDADDVNAMVITLNRLAALVNTEASAYNDTAGKNGEEFEEAVFVSAAGHEEINVYEYDSQASLRRVLAHELGHALGLDHVDDAAAIMYRLNQSANAKPTAADIAELKAVCRL